jgi:hypothetical protein
VDRAGYREFDGGEPEFYTSCADFATTGKGTPVLSGRQNKTPELCEKPRQK